MNHKDAAQRQPIDETDKWFRDMLMKLMGWGVATFLIMAGGLLQEGAEFSFFIGDSVSFYRAFALLFFSSCFWLVWAVTVAKIRSRCPDHPTVLKNSLVKVYVASMLGAVVVLVWLVLND
ncbi:MAG: hypothetical protein J7K75_10485 [Desulfuromonas sp.]|nr:hypothetical protein [Desulfuromonas sp.]